MDVIMFPVNLKATSGLLILLHCVISLPDATSYDKYHYFMGWPNVFFHRFRLYDSKVFQGLWPKEVWTLSLCVL